MLTKHASQHDLLNDQGSIMEQHEPVDDQEFFGNEDPSQAIDFAAASVAQQSLISKKSHLNFKQPEYKIDAQLIKMMEKIEIQSRQKVEQFAELLDIYGKDKRFQKRMNGRFRFHELARKDKRQADARLKEE